jgi:hypothetical protein
LIHLHLARRVHVINRCIKLVQIGSRLVIPEESRHHASEREELDAGRASSVGAGHWTPINGSPRLPKCANSRDWESGGEANGEEGSRWSGNNGSGEAGGGEKRCEGVSLQPGQQQRKRLQGSRDHSTTCIRNNSGEHLHCVPVGAALTTRCLPTHKDHRTFDSGADIYSATWDVKP